MFTAAINQFTGTLSTELGQLKELLYLLISSNQLTGTVQSELGNLSKLTMFWLHDNQFTGQSPREILDLNLEDLCLNNNDFSGFVPQEIETDYDCTLNITSRWAHEKENNIIT